jgi:hypothetical protein
MSNTATKKMLRKYEERQPVTMFFSSLFQSPLENFHNSETVEIDIERSDEDVAIVVTDLSTGYRMNESSLYTNKEFTPPLFKEAFAINAYDMIKRQAGNHPFQDASFQANAMSQFSEGMAKAERLILRATELQASQVMQTGIVTLVNSAGTTVYTIDYKPKASHFPTAGTAWDAASPTILADLDSLMDQIRDDGKEDPDVSVWGIESYNAALANADFRALFDTRRVNAGEITRLQDRGNGAKFRGTLDVGNYPLEIWTHNGRYKHPQTGTITKYLAGDKVCIFSSSGRRDMTWGNVPIIIPPSQRVLPFVPQRVRRTGAGGVDMITNTWCTADGEQLFGGISARPLAIPTAIDTLGCIDTGV